MAESSLVRLAGTVSIAEHAGGFVLIQGRDCLKITGNRDVLGPLLRDLSAGSSVEDLGIRHSPDRVASVVEQLRTCGWLVYFSEDDALNTPWRTQVEYLTVFGPDAPAMQERINAARVGVVGVGGIGGLVAMHCVAAGVKRLWLSDHDVVAVSNLNRQILFGVDDIGQAKVDAARRSLMRLAPDMDVVTHCRRLAAPADYKLFPDDLDLLVVAADTPRNVMEAACAWAGPRGVPATHAGVGLESGFWGPLLVPAVGHSWQRFEHQRLDALSPGSRFVESLSWSPSPYSFGPSNAVIAALLAHDVVKFLVTGQCLTLGRRAVFDLAQGTISFSSSI